MNGCGLKGIGTVLEWVKIGSDKRQLGMQDYHDSLAEGESRYEKLINAAQEKGWVAKA